MFLIAKYAEEVWRKISVTLRTMDEEKIIEGEPDGLILEEETESYRSYKCQHC